MPSPMVNKAGRSLIALPILLAAALAAPLGAQTAGTVAGTVVDGETGEPLDGVHVHIPALGIGVLSRDGGRFALSGVPAGTHELRADLIGHLDLTRTVAVEEGETVVLELRLERSVLLIEALVVTGTAFAESPIELPYAVTVTGRRTLAEQGSPQAFDLFRNVTASHGILGGRHGWLSTRPPARVSETVANVNLRGIGASRTLVLLNGRRQVYLPVRLSSGRFVDVSAFPAVALDRVEVVKEGASAVYGSDAVAGVVNFLTRGDFDGLEVSAAHEAFAGAGESSVGAIWGGDVPGGARAVVAAEIFATQELTPEERDWALTGYVPGGGGWSYTGNPGAFLFPKLTGDETRDEFLDALLDAHYGGWGGVFVDPRCDEFGGFREDATCRFRYQPWDVLQEDSRQIRAFAEVNGTAGDRSRYHAEALWAEATVPTWITTPSFPPISPYNGTQLIEPGHPGRRAFCAAHGTGAGFATREECLADDWFYFGRLVGNSGPPRSLRRDSRTQRLAGTFERDLELFGEREAVFEVAASLSRSTGNSNLPGEYMYRKFLAFRGFGGPDCGVGVVLDPDSPSGMALGAPGGAVAGEGGCMYYNPFSNAHTRSAQPGSPYHGQANPDHVAGLENRAELIDWINGEVNLDNEASLLAVETMLRGALGEDGAEYALGYQFRRLSVAAQPNPAGDLAIFPCPVPDDHSCPVKVGPFHFTTGFHHYDDAQIVHRLFAESQLELGDRIHGQLAANYEFHGSVSSFDPKLAVRVRLAEPLALRASVQTTMRTPSVDDLNEDINTGLDYVAESGLYKAIDSYGDRDLVPERAFTYNVGVSLLLPRVRATLDYWDYDFRDVIDVVPHAGITRLYAAGGSARAAIQSYVTCPDGRGTGTCDIQSVERIEVRNANWPGIRMSGLDMHASSRLPVGEGIVSLGLDGTYTRDFVVRALELGGTEVVGEHDAVGKLNWGNPIAPPLPQWKSNLSAGYHRGDYSAVNHVNVVSGYVNEAFVGTEFEEIDRFVTWDVSVLRRTSGNLDVGMSVLNVLDAAPPPVRWEAAFDGFTHSPKGRRIKVSLTWRPAG